MGRFTATTGRTTATGHAGSQCSMQLASGDTWNGDVEVVWQSSRGMSIEKQRWLPLLQALPKLIAQTFEALTAASEIANC